MTQGMSSGQTTVDKINLRCDLDLKKQQSKFSQDIPTYNDVSSNQAGCKQVKSLEEVVGTVIF